MAAIPAQATSGGTAGSRLTMASDIDSLLSIADVSLTGLTRRGSLPRPPRLGGNAPATSAITAAVNAAAAASAAASSSKARAIVDSKEEARHAQPAAAAAASSLWGSPIDLQAQVAALQATANGRGPQPAATVYPQRHFASSNHPVASAAAASTVVAPVSSNSGSTARQPSVHGTPRASSSTRNQPSSSFIVGAGGLPAQPSAAARDNESSSPIERVLTRPPNLRQKSMGAVGGNGPLVLPAAAGATNSGATTERGGSAGAGVRFAAIPPSASRSVGSSAGVLASPRVSYAAPVHPTPMSPLMAPLLLHQHSTPLSSSPANPAARGMPSASLPTSPIVSTMSPSPPIPYHHISGPVPFAGSLLATSDLDYHATIQRRVAGASLLPMVGGPSVLLSPTPPALHQSPPLPYRPTPPKFARASSIGSPVMSGVGVVGSPQHTPVPPATSASIFVSPLQLGDKAPAAPTSRTPRNAALATINLNAASPLSIGASSAHFPLPPPMNLSRRGTMNTSTRLALQMPQNDEQILTPVMVTAGGGATPPPAQPANGASSAPNSAKVPQPPVSPSTYFRSTLQPSSQLPATARVSFATNVEGSAAAAVAPEASEAASEGGVVRRNSRKSFIAGATPLAPGLVALSSASPSPASVLSSPRTPRHHATSPGPATRDRLGSVHWEDDTSAVDLTNRTRARSTSHGATSSRASSASTDRSAHAAAVTDEDGTVNNEELDDERELQLAASRRVSNATPGTDAQATSDTEATSSSSKPNSRRGTLNNKFALVDPITGLPLAAVQAKRRASAVYMGMLPDAVSAHQTALADSAALLAAAGVTSPSHDGRALSHEQAAAAAQQVLNSLSPLHAAALHQSTTSSGANSVPVQMAVGELALSNMMSAVRVKQVELSHARVAPTLMQQAKVITAAIIMQKQARLAERRAVLQKRQAEQDAYEAALEAQHAVADSAAREARIREQQAMLERKGSASFSPRSSAAGGYLSAFSGGGGGAAGGPRSSREGGGDSNEPRFRPTFVSKHSSIGNAFDFSEFDFSGSGTAWGKDAIGSHLLRSPRAVATAAPAAPAAPEEPPPIVPHVTGFGSGSVSDNNGAHHPLMNPSHPNYLSHLNPNSSNYNSHINPRHANFNPLNNPAHPEHDPKYNNPRSEHFNPFYNHPKFRMQGTAQGTNPMAQKKEPTMVRDGDTEDLVEALQELHGGSTNHPAHPSHPLFTPHHAEDLVAMLPQDHPVLQIVTKEWAHAQAVANVDGSIAAAAAITSPQASPRASDSNAVITPHGGAYKWGRSSATAASPTSVSPTMRSPLVRRGPHVGLSAFQAKRAQLAEKRQQGAASLMQQAKAALRAAAEGHEYVPPITARPGVSLTQQLSELSPQQLEQLRRETINATLGMHDSPSNRSGGRSGPPQPADSPSSGGITMSKFFRDTLQQALGGDEIWQMAKDIHSEGGKSNGKRGVAGEGISLSSLSLQAHMALFGAGALTDSDGRPLDSQGNYLDCDAGDSRGGRGVGVAIAPFPPKKFFLDAEVERYEQELRLQLMRDHETRVREYQDMINLARRKWHAGREGSSSD